MNADSDLLDSRQAMRLLAGMTTGRVIYTAGALPAVLPVRFLLAEDGSVLLDAHPSADLVRAAEGGVIAFEAGEIDQSDGNGWSVTLLGRADVITGGDGHMRTSGPDTAAPAGRTVIRMYPELVSGRRFGALPRGAGEP
ncbi:pyridoxamine 5'-phosphate oxidase family protein [Streptomyces sp. NPDC097704]|uniref:pyridoxamine 5'-phosphate oxidase family protein n=1 Tax=Streptomyces sp. NPDC097704 TaxID=3157101 RepID=UPI0033264D08